MKACFDPELSQTSHQFDLEFDAEYGSLVGNTVDENARQHNFISFVSRSKSHEQAKSTFVSVFELKCLQESLKGTSMELNLYWPS